MNSKRLITVALLPLLVTACQKSTHDAGAGGASGEAVVLESDVQVYSYGVGYQIGSQMAASPMDLDGRGLIAGIQDALDKAEMRVDQQRMQDVAQRMQASMMEQQQAEQSRLAASNAQAATEFLAENAGKANVVSLDSGLQYRVIESAEGEKPGEDSTVVVNYRGTLIDGTEFDSSYARGEPVTFPVGNVIPGWQEALKLMQVGSKWEVFVPPDLAYGSGGQGPIPPNSALIFEIELLEIAPQE